MWEEYGFDCKFAASLIQILMIGIQLADKGRIDFPLDCASMILDIKKGEYTQDWVYREGNRLIDALSKAKRTSTVLPDGPRYKEIDFFVIQEMRQAVGTDGYV
jgi:hypothetical protein